MRSSRRAVNDQGIDRESVAGCAPVCQREFAQLVGAAVGEDVHEGFAVGGCAQEIHGGGEDGLLRALGVEDEVCERCCDEQDAGVWVESFISGGIFGDGFERRSAPGEEDDGVWVSERVACWG